MLIHFHEYATWFCNHTHPFAAQNIVSVLFAYIRTARKETPWIPDVYLVVYYNYCTRPVLDQYLHFATSQSSF